MVYALDPKGQAPAALRPLWLLVLRVGKKSV